MKLDVIPLHTLLHTMISNIVGATVSDFGLPWDLLAEIDFFGLKLFFDQLLVKKKWVPFFPANIRASGGHFENYYHKRINC